MIWSFFLVGYRIRLFESTLCYTNRPYFFPIYRRNADGLRENDATIFRNDIHNK